MRVGTMIFPQQNSSLREMTANLIIAIDGEAGSGKGTLAQAIAEKYALIHIDSGMLYRQVASAINQGATISQAIESLLLEPVDKAYLQQGWVATKASELAQNPEIRASINRFMYKTVARHSHRAVIDGRDISTVVFPKAVVKFYITADSSIRAQRRHDQIGQNQRKASKQPINLNQQSHESAKDLSIRDKNDSQRPIAALMKAEEAKVIDTSHISIAEMIEEAIVYIESIINNSGEYPM